MQVLIALYNFQKEISIGIENGNGKPHPLRCSKEWDCILNGIKECAVSNLYQFSKLQEDSGYKSDVSMFVYTYPGTRDQLEEAYLNRDGKRTKSSSTKATRKQI